MKNRIGVYICQCGSNISDYVDVNSVSEEIKNLSDIVLSKVTMFACADSTQREMVNDIKKNNLDGLVVASCSPKLHTETFRNVAKRAGLNPYNYFQVNIREQDSWAHSNDPAGATKKAIRMIRAGVVKVKNSESMETISIPAENSVAIIGAGISGLRSAIEMADMGSNVFLIEKDHFVGGRVAEWENLCTVKESGSELVTRLYKEMKKRKNITLFTGVDILGLSGSVGNFILSIGIRPRYIVNDPDRDRLTELIGKCRERIPDEFNYGLTKRKVVFKKYSNALPDKPIVDIDNIGDEISLLKEYKDCVDFEQKSENLNVKAGAVILSTGFDPYEPKDGEYGYKKIKNIITFQQLKRLIEFDHEEFNYKGKKIKNIAYIYCVGSCEIEGENKYCSRYCCTCAISTASFLKKKYKDINSFHLYRHIRTYGKQEVIYDEALRGGDIFLKFLDDDPPKVSEEDGVLTVKINDQLTDGEEIELEPDLVVLITGMIPRKDSKDIANVFKTPIGRDRFFNEVHPKLRPVETVIDGVFIAGTCQGPKSISESMKSALSAASKAGSLINKGEITLEPTVAVINNEKCLWCGKCAEICPFNAISKEKGKDKTVAKVNIATCKGCGICVPVCDTDAIYVKGYSDEEIEGMISSIGKELREV